MITVATWNVLHRIHAQNWGEDATDRWPDEAERIAAITASLAGRTEHVIALQEVSGDQLAGLRQGLPERTVHTLRYPRVPAPRRGASPLTDPAEYLVLLTDGAARPVAAEPFPDDRGKGLLAVRAAGALVIATHVSFGPRRTGQLARLAKLAGESLGPVVLLGDFNADPDTVTTELGRAFTAAGLGPDEPPTRPGGKSPFIDHVIVRGAAVTGGAVEDVNGLSDHNLLSATVTW